MSSLARPTGPLPPRVYWIRRLMALLIVVVVVALVWWLISAFASGDKQDPAGSPPAGSVTTDPSDETPSTSEPPTRERPTKDKPVQDKPTKDKPAEQNKPTKDKPAEQDPSEQPTPTETAPTTPLAQPTGDCIVEDVDITVQVDDVSVGDGVTATLEMTSLGPEACTLGITPDVLVARVTSGSDTIWSSTDCPAQLPVKEVVVRKDVPATYDVTWNGRRSSGNCSPGEEESPPGGYWFETALIGGEPHKGYFDVTG